MQMTFGAIVGMESVVPPAPARVECVECDGLIDLSDVVEVDGRALCADCAESAGYARCSECGDVTDSFSRDESGDLYCESCYDGKYIRCKDCNNEVSVDDAFRSSGGDHYCENCYNERFYHCESCGHEVCNDSVRTDDSGNVYCEECYSDHYTSCEECGDEIDRESAYYLERNGCSYCEGCYPGEGSEGEGWDYGRFRPGAVYKEIRSQRKFGVELETSKCDGYHDLEGETCFDCRDDGSIKGKEFTSPVLSSDEGLAAIRKFCRLAANNDFEIDRDCGFHAHFDVADLSAEEKASVAYAYHRTYEVWAAFVNSSRRNNHYCKAVGWGRDDLERLLDNDDWRDFSRNTDRYVWINLNAFSKHRTFEVRLHTATLDADKVCNWVKAHTRFIDWAAGKTLDEIDEIFGGIGSSTKSKFRVIATIWADTELTDFYGSRAREFGTDLTTTRKLQPVAV